MPKQIQRILILIALSFACLYLGDYLLLRHKITTNHSPYGTIQIESYSTVPEKGNKVEFFYNDPTTEECVHSLFPHSGDPACWLAAQTQEKRTDL